MRRQQSGFTLIELIIVVVILGILAVTAAPRFLDLSDQANSAARAGVQGAVDAAADTARAQFLVTNGSDADTSVTGTQVTVDGTSITVDDDNTDADGYPTAVAAGIGAAVDLSSQWQGIVGQDASNNPIYIFVAQPAATPIDATNNASGAQCVAYSLNANDAPVTSVGTFTFVGATTSTCV